VVTLAEFQDTFEDEMGVDQAKEKEVYLNDALEEIIEGPDEGEL